ncbi:mechanosensitive ion channel domain-containing protein [Erythrobacter donghaensis]|uniref:mechanosensitive ion channel domain-containing protein n=1 Tax=Erythrobacter donghaensis TaxID=267135 RepID=UPI001FEA5713|nr:mechanosensitive ion channel domain-containing protein [Erythrobacter donghaensis]
MSDLAALALLIAASLAPTPASAQLIPENTAGEATADPKPVIEAADATPTDAAIAERLNGIFAEIDPLAGIAVEVKSGVVTLSGTVATNADIERAERIAARVAGVVTVQNGLERDLAVAGKIDPLTTQLSDRLDTISAGLPLLGLALALVAGFWILGGLLARFTGLWRAITPNAFLAELVATGVRVVFVIIGLILALDLLEATALLGAILGSAGVIGLAVGFAIRDTVDNYVSSIMLSIRQPFRANDHVVIGEFEGHVIRLTSRATILMTLDGNHLRVPNATVFKSEILNYTTNPQRRFSFVLGIDAEDDPAAAIATGLARLNELPFVLSDPAATAFIEEVGDSNIVIRFLAWIDQTQTAFPKARTSAIAATMQVLEAEGFGLPEPIYRLRFDGATPLTIASGNQQLGGGDATAKSAKAQAKPRTPCEEIDTSADSHIARKVAEERAQGGGAEADILDAGRPLE